MAKDLGLGSQQDVARQSPPAAIATARSKTTLAGSWTANGLRHGANSADKAFVKALTDAVCSNNVAPDVEISDSPPEAR
jgi:hypothetical protein